MKIACWNVNSLRARLPRVCAWLDANKPDVLCAQGIKAEDASCPRAEIEGQGYRVSLHGQKTYNGVAFFSREEPRELERGFPGDAADAQRRLIAGTFGDVRVVNVYVPNGQTVGSEKFAY